MRHALFLPPVGELADPGALMHLAAAAEAAGWDGCFLWDHLLRPTPEPPAIADPWICAAAVATCTSRLRIGPMVTPLPSRRPQRLAKEIVTLDRLSRGRVTVGLGLGHDGYGELSRFGETVDAVTRGDQLDEGVDLLARLLTGAHVDHRGAHFTAADVRLLPEPVQRPRPPLWLAARAPTGRPVRRALRYDGIVVVDVDADDVGRIAEQVLAARGTLDRFDIAVSVAPGEDAGAHEARGATWALRAVAAGQGIREVEAVIDAGR
jgi:alkanesulfonate monooxygenase SsuD/methylene tetrahydromethanopterin reductase-like flavin-dependent oxidoreductase (luciferase family)